MFNLKYTLPIPVDQDDYHHVIVSQVDPKNHKSVNEDLTKVLGDLFTGKSQDLTEANVLEVLHRVFEEKPNKPIAINLERNILDYEVLPEKVILRVEVLNWPETFEGKSFRLTFLEISEDDILRIATNGMSGGVREFSLSEQPAIWKHIFAKNLTRDDLFHMFEFGTEVL